MSCDWSAPVLASDWCRADGGDAGHDAGRGVLAGAARVPAGPVPGLGPASQHLASHAHPGPGRGVRRNVISFKIIRKYMKEIYSSDSIQTASARPRLIIKGSAKNFLLMHSALMQ